MTRTSRAPRGTLLLRAGYLPGRGKVSLMPAGKQYRITGRYCPQLPNRLEGRWVWCMVACPTMAKIGLPNLVRSELAGDKMKSLSHYSRLLAGAVVAAGLLLLSVVHATADDLATIKRRGT